MAGIVEVWHSKQRANFRVVREHNLRDSMTEVDSRVLVTNMSEEMNWPFIDMKAEIKQVEAAIIKAINEPRRKQKNMTRCISSDTTA